MSGKAPAHKAHHQDAKTRRNTIESGMDDLQLQDLLEGIESRSL